MKAAAAALVGLSLLLMGCFTSVEYPDETSAYVSQRGLIINSARARALHAAGALFLDARDPDEWANLHVIGSQTVRWETFSHADPPELRGRLLDDDKLLGERLRAIGVSRERAVVVVGESVGGWGEDGRIAWMLRALGHDKTYLYDGGAAALRSSRIPVDSGPASAATAAPAKAGDFVVARSAAWDVTRDALQTLVTSGAVSRGDVVLVDTRERREFDGETPYGEQRGGHVPGAVHLHYEDLLDASGRLRARDALLAKLRAVGVREGSDVISYCTAGVRSGWLVYVLTDLGIKSRNYAGSMWEWSAGDANTFPLQTR